MAYVLHLANNYFPVSSCYLPFFYLSCLVSSHFKIQETQETNLSIACSSDLICNSLPFPGFLISGFPDACILYPLICIKCNWSAPLLLSGFARPSPPRLNWIHASEKQRKNCKSCKLPAKSSLNVCPVWNVEVWGCTQASCMISDNPLLACLGKFWVVQTMKEMDVIYYTRKLGVYMMIWRLYWDVKVYMFNYGG